MSIYTDSYQTTIGSVYATDKIVSSIKESIIKDYIDEVTLGVRGNEDISPIFITGSFASEANIPIFTHPISINYKNKRYLVTDIRHFIRKGTPFSDIESGIRNRTEFNFVKGRAVLNMLWLAGYANQMRMGLSFAGTVYAAWISEAISRTYALDFKDQTTIAVIASFFYQTLFKDTKEWTEDELERLVIHTIKATKTDETFVMPIFKKIIEQNPKFSTLEDFCKAVVNNVENVRLTNFGLGMLLTLIKSSWYGTNSKDILSVSLEHPPTFISIIYTTLNERTYKNSILYKIAERFGKRGESDEFMKTYASMVKEHIAMETDNSDIIINDFV